MRLLIILWRYSYKVEVWFLIFKIILTVFHVNKSDGGNPDEKVNITRLIIENVYNIWDMQLRV